MTGVMPLASVSTERLARQGNALDLASSSLKAQRPGDLAHGQPVREHVVDNDDPATPSARRIRHL
jgi:hypothetical protein